MVNGTIKLVVCDIDDTLVHKELHLSKKVIDTIKKLRYQGVYFTFATGRMPYRVEVFAEEAELDIPFVANNGSVLYSKGKAVYRKLFQASILKDTLRGFMSVDPEFTVIFSYEDRECPIRRTSWIEARLHKYRGYDEILGDTDEVWGQDVHKVYVLDDGRTGLIGKVAAALKSLDGGLNYFQYGEYSIEIVADGCTKASGVERLIEYIKVEKDQVMAIGDHTNDIEVVSMVGLGIAVANADPKLKSVADYITYGAYENGVIEAIDRFVLNAEGTKDGKNNR